MREILFRGLHRRKGEKVKLNGMPVEGMWVYGGYCQYNAERGIIYQKEPFNKFSVYADSVGQYTSLTDKNGKMIFEGDIIRADVQRFIVKFGKCGGVENIDGDVGYMGFYITPVNVKYAKFFRTDILFWINAYGAEVIGNIHDNPELIETN